jgi:Zn-dependent protease
MPNWWVTDALEQGGPPFLFAYIIWVIVSITLHELAHGWAAVAKGDNTPIVTGHMTWNPLVHMGLPSLLMFAVTGMAWGLMPIDPSRMRGKHADAWVALCGPLMNFGLAVVCIIGSAVVMKLAPGGVRGLKTDTTEGAVLLFFAFGCWLNIGLGLFNLLPAPPLDGSRIAASYSRQYRDLAETAGGQFGGMATLIIGFVVAPKLVWELGPWIWRHGIEGIFAGLRAVGVGP